jgi:hypothetical protein
MGAVGKIVGGVVGGIGGFMLGGPVGAVAGATIGSGALSNIGKKSSPPAPVNQVPGGQAIGSRLPPVNLVQIIDELSNDRLDLARSADGKIALRFAGSRNKVDLGAPVNTGSFDGNLPPVRRITGRNITEEAAAVIALTQSMRQLIGTIEQVERSNPMLLEQNQGLLQNFRAAQQLAVERNFDIRQNGIDTKLAKMGLLNSSTGLGAQVFLARERADAQLKADLDYSTLAQNLKQQSLENMYKRGDQLANTANVELGRFATETRNQLEMRGQDMQAQQAEQQLEQSRAYNQSQLQLARNDQLIQAELGRRNLIAGQEGNNRNSLLSAGLNLLNSGNEQAIGARSVDNQAINNANQWQYQRYAMTSNPWQQAGNMAIGNFMGRVGGQLGDSASAMIGQGLTKFIGM